MPSIHTPSKTLRASYSFQPAVLKRFNAVVPVSERSKVVEALLEQVALAREKELQSIADIYMTDPAFAQCREDEALWEKATVNDGLKNHGRIVFC